MLTLSNPLGYTCRLKAVCRVWPEKYQAWVVKADLSALMREPVVVKASVHGGRRFKCSK